MQTKMLVLPMITWSLLSADLPVQAKDAKVRAYFQEKNLSPEEQGYVREVNAACGRGDTTDVPTDPSLFKCPRTKEGAQKLIQLGKDPRAERNPDLRDFAFFAANVMAGKVAKGTSESLSGGQDENTLSVLNAEAFDQTYHCEADKNGKTLTAKDSNLKYHPSRLLSSSLEDCAECKAKKKDATFSAAGIDSSLANTLATGGKVELTKDQFQSAANKGWEVLKADVRGHSNRLVMERLRSEAFLMGYLHSGTNATKNSADFADRVTKGLTCRGKTAAETAQNRRALESLYHHIEQETGPAYDGEQGRTLRTKAMRDHMQAVTYAAACRDSLAQKVVALRSTFGLGQTDTQKYQDLVSESYRHPIGSAVKKYAGGLASVVGDTVMAARPIALPLVLFKLPGNVNSLGSQCSEFYRTQAYRSINVSPENQICQKKLQELQVLDAQIRTLDSAYPNLSVVMKDGELLSQKLVKASNILSEFPEVSSYQVDVDSPSPQSCMNQFQVKVDGGEALKAWPSQEHSNAQYAATEKLYRDFVSGEAVKRATETAQEICAGDQDTVTVALLQSPSFAESFYSCNRPSNPLLAYYASVENKDAMQSWPVDRQTVGDPDASASSACTNRRSSTWVACAEARRDLNIKNSSFLAVSGGIQSILGDAMAAGGFTAMVPSSVKLFTGKALAGATKGLFVGAGFGAGFHAVVMDSQLKDARAQAAQNLQSIDIGLGEDLTRAQAEQAIADIPGWMESVVPGALLGGLAEVSLSKLHADLASSVRPEVASRMRSDSVALSRLERAAFREAWEQTKGASDLVSDEVKKLNRILDGKEPLTRDSAHLLDGISSKAGEIMLKKRQEFESNLGKLLSKVETKRVALTEELSRLEKTVNRSAQDEKRLTTVRKELAQLEKDLGPRTLIDKARAYLGLKDKRLMSYWDETFQGERGEFLQLSAEFEKRGCTLGDFRTFIGYMATTCGHPKMKAKAPQFSAQCRFVM